MLKERAKLLKKWFAQQDETWRIEAVIHDGNWYDKTKWAKISKVNITKIDDWVKRNEDILIKSDINSYRVDYDEILRWYKKENIKLDKNIIPNNFPPKIWAGKTETDVFLEAPRRRVGTVSFVANTPEILSRCIQVLKGTGKVMPDKDGRHKAHGLSALHMKNLLSKGLSQKEFDSLDIKTRAVLMQRELIDLPEEWLKNAVEFYAKRFAPNELKSSLSTISIYLTNEDDVASQTAIWVIQAMKKFDESASVPFSGYLSTVLKHWPYNLPDEHLGKELSRFQRERKRAIDEAIAEGYSNENVPIEVIAEIMDISISDYIELTGEHETWLAEKNATTLTWEDSSNEKQGTLIGDKVTIQGDRSKMANLSLATVKAAVDTSEWESAYEVIFQIDQCEIDEEIRSKLSESFLESLYNHLQEVMSR